MAWIKDPTHWWLMDFAIENDLWAEQLGQLADKSDYFSSALKKAKTVQKSRIVKLAMARKIDTTMAIFTLKNVAGWRDKKPDENEIVIKNYVQIYRPEPYTSQELETASQDTIRQT